MKSTKRKPFVTYQFNGLTIMAKDMNALAIVLETMEFVNEQCHRYERYRFLNL